MMQALLRAESIKIRRHAAVWLPVLAPAVAVGLCFIALAGQEAPPKLSPDAIWRALTRNAWALWLAVFMPMLIAFEAAALVNLEHDGKQWKQLFALPVARSQVYATKMLLCLALVGASVAAFAIGLIADVLIIGVIHQLPLIATIPWVDILGQAARAIAASASPMIVLQLWFSVRRRGFATPVGWGIGALLLGAFLSPIEFFHSKLWYPWTLPVNTLGGRDVHAMQMAVPVMIGCFGGVPAGVAACWDLARRSESD